MHLEQLIYFDAVAKSGSISKAAVHLYVSQSTVSTAISNLEKELQVTLFKRSQNGVALTEQGQAALAYVRRALDELSGLRSYAKSCQGVMESTIYLASAPSFSQCVLTNVLSRLLQIAPEIHLHVQEKLHHQIIQALCTGQIDLGVVGYFQEEAETVQAQCAKQGITMHELYKSRNYLYCRAKHPILEQDTAIDQAFSAYPLLVCRHMRQAAAQAFGSQVIREVDSYAQIKALIGQSDFIALLPDMYERSALAGERQIVRLSCAVSVPESHYSWIKLASNPLLPAEERVLEMIGEQLDSTGHSG